MVKLKAILLVASIMDILVLWMTVDSYHIGRYGWYGAGMLLLGLITMAIYIGCSLVRHHG